ncbi:MAG: hypothetical protein ACQEVA_20600 [Myxococcota bacterium]
MKLFEPTKAALLAVVLGLALAIAAPSFADNGGKYSQQVDQFSQILQQQAERDKEDVATKDRERVQTWLENVEVLLANGNEGKAKRLLKQVEFAITMMDEMITAKEIERLADRQEEAYFKAEEEQIPKLKKEIEKLEDERKELEDELEQLQ